MHLWFKVPLRYVVLIIVIGERGGGSKLQLVSLDISPGRGSRGGGCPEEDRECRRQLAIRFGGSVWRFRLPLVAQQSQGDSRASTALTARSSSSC
ncbi:hypothetical protein B0T24DRAFT_638141 [Lasiosphaeria ovina]|uniref:Uncharacterized protein n=1 Tax=Lasiosphaeria ovina TaxID=92902 RepID=A0AAE0N1M6_9PEZI|nr:hypothetical protein B0T24DRAFT_638141 [Lasiosphaeria ovina]